MRVHTNTHIFFSDRWDNKKTLEYMWGKIKMSFTHTHLTDTLSKDTEILMMC